MSLAKILVDHGWLNPHQNPPGRRCTGVADHQRIRTDEHPRFSRPTFDAALARRLRPVAPIASRRAQFEALDLRTRASQREGRRPARHDRDIIQFENGAPFHWDVESRSAAKLGKGKESVGARAYAEHPSTEVLCVSFARGNGPVETWIPGQPIPEVVLAAAADPRCPWVAHNAAFERAMLECILIPRHGWPMVPVDRHVCTMSLALAHAYPGSLDGVAEILGLVNRKDIAREKIVRVMWKPRKPRRG